MYDPRTGRFLQLDPLGLAAGDPDLYRFVGNNPTNETDPLGLYPPERMPDLGHLNVAIGFGKDWFTDLADLWNAIGTDTGIITDGDHPDWKKLLDWIYGVPSSHKFGSVVIAGHGTRTSIGKLTLEALQDENSNAYKFLVAFKKNVGPDTIIDLRSCWADDDPEGQRFLKRVAELTGARVIGYTDKYAITPHGDEYTAYPKGEVKRTHSYPPYKGSTAEKLARCVGK